MKYELEQAYERLLSSGGVVFLLGDIDTGKTTFGIELAHRAAEAGLPAAIVDADIVQSTVGPPTTVGLKLIAPNVEVTRESLRVADSLAFVGSMVPKGHLLPLVTGTAKLVARAREMGCGLIVVDTSSLVSGIYGQTLKHFKMDLVAPQFVVAFERGGELEPLVGIAQRFTPAEVIQLPVPSNVYSRSIDERAAFREQQFAAYFSTKTSRWRVRPTVFMPTLPPEFDLGLLEGLVVGMEDGKGECVGSGLLGYEAETEIRR